ncbi:hypothetical protein [Rossellomorea marisflavi]|uniref:hypothetical protein n=1 Tax=Rossellomorea marisflavi TaxID=189381 RepID=UPI003512C304
MAMIILSFIFTLFFLCLSYFFMFKQVKLGENLIKTQIEQIRKSILNPGDHLLEFTLMNIAKKKVESKTLKDKSMIFLIVGAGCSACDIDVIEFAEESLKYSEYYNYILVIYSQEPHLLSNSLPKNNFKEILIADDNLLQSYKISRFPTFLLINKDFRFISYAKYVSDLRGFYDPHKIKGAS